MQPVSVYIITKNEAQRIGRAVCSVVEWADEVIVVDSGSTDDTVAIAASSGARVLHRDWNGYGPQKRFAEDQCRNDWVLNIDADEEVTAELAKEIQSAVDHAADDIAAFKLRITDLLPGETRLAPFAYSYHVLRLYNRQRGNMSIHPYQDRVEIASGRVKSLRGRILHHSFVSWSKTTEKLNFYTSEVGDTRAAAGKIPSVLRVWFEFPATFLKMWLLRRFIFRGTMGFAISLNVSWLNVLRLLKTRESATAATQAKNHRNAA